MTHGLRITMRMRKCEPIEIPFSDSLMYSARVRSPNWVLNLAQYRWNQSSATSPPLLDNLHFEQIDKYFNLGLWLSLLSICSKWRLSKKGGLVADDWLKHARQAISFPKSLFGIIKSCAKTMLWCSSWSYPTRTRHATGWVATMLQQTTSRPFGGSMLDVARGHIAGNFRLDQESNRSRCDAHLVGFLDKIAMWRPKNCAISQPLKLV